MKIYKKKRFVGHGNPYDRIFRNVLNGAATAASKGPLADGFRADTQELMLKGTEQAINDILTGDEDTKKIIRRTGTTIKKNLGRVAKMKLKNKIFKSPHSVQRKSLKGGALLYSLNVQKKSRRKIKRKKRANSNKKIKINKNLRRRRLSAQTKFKSRRRGKRKKKIKKRIKHKSKRKKRVKFHISNFIKQKRKIRKQGATKRAGKIFPTVFDL